MMHGKVRAEVPRYEYPGINGSNKRGSNCISMADFCKNLSEIFGNDLIEINWGERDFSLDDWLLRTYNIKINAREDILTLIEQKLLNY